VSFDNKTIFVFVERFTNVNIHRFVLWLRIMNIKKRIYSFQSNEIVALKRVHLHMKSPSDEGVPNNIIRFVILFNLTFYLIVLFLSSEIKALQEIEDHENVCWIFRERVFFSFDKFRLLNYSMFFLMVSVIYSFSNICPVIYRKLYEMSIDHWQILKSKVTWECYWTEFRFVMKIELCIE